MERKFGIFLSSTKIDLEEERKIFIDSIIASGHLLVGMESFTGGDDQTWDLVEEKLRCADGLVLIIGGCYGSLVEGEEISYTEKEYDWAKTHDIPVIIFRINENSIKKLPYEKVEDDEEKRRKFELFKNKFNGRFVNQWRDTADLKEKAYNALPAWLQTLEKNRSRGWVRVQDVKTEQLKIELDVYRYILNALTPPSRNLRIKRALLDKLVVDFAASHQLRESTRYLIQEYAVPRATQISPDIRVYFAYRLSENRQSQTQNGAFLYQISISNSKESEWIPGCLVGKNSNIHKVFTIKEPRIINDVNDPNNGRNNARVEGEESVMNEPVNYDDQIVGVLGLSSPKKGEFYKEELIALAEELATILSALMFAYGAHRCRDLSIEDSESRAIQIREEISESYSDLDIDGGTLSVGE
jgi:hypothetical protein